MKRLNWNYSDKFNMVVKFPKTTGVFRDNWGNKNMKLKKIRGIRRKYDNMATSIIENTSSFPEITSKYWHLHLPTSYGFINSSNLSNKIKIQCIQLLIDRAWGLSELRPKDKENYRVVVAIIPEELWSSQIIIFKDDNYFADFFNRDDDYQVWNPIPKEEIFRFEQYLSIPDDFLLLGYKEMLYDDGRKFAPTYIRNIWFVGDM